MAETTETRTAHGERPVSHTTCRIVGGVLTAFLFTPSPSTFSRSGYSLRSSR